MVKFILRDVDQKGLVVVAHRFNLDAPFGAIGVE